MGTHIFSKQALPLNLSPVQVPIIRRVCKSSLLIKRQYNTDIFFSEDLPQPVIHVSYMEHYYIFDINIFFYESLGFFF